MLTASVMVPVFQPVFPVTPQLWVAQPKSNFLSEMVSFEYYLKARRDKLPSKKAWKINMTAKEKYVSPLSIPLIILPPFKFILQPLRASQPSGCELYRSENTCSCQMETDEKGLFFPSQSVTVKGKNYNNNQKKKRKFPNIGRSVIDHYVTRRGLFKLFECSV